MPVRLRKRLTYPVRSVGSDCIVNVDTFSFTVSPPIVLLTDAFVVSDRINTFASISARAAQGLPIITIVDVFLAPSATVKIKELGYQV